MKCIEVYTHTYIHTHTRMCTHRCVCIRAHLRYRPFSLSLGFGAPMASAQVGFYSANVYWGMCRGTLTQPGATVSVSVSSSSQRHSLGCLPSRTAQGAAPSSSPTATWGAASTCCTFASASPARASSWLPPTFRKACPAQCRRCHGAKS